MKFKSALVFLACIFTLSFVAPVSGAMQTQSDYPLSVAMPGEIPNVIDRALYYAFNKINRNISVSSYNLTSAVSRVHSGQNDVLAVETEEVLGEAPGLVVVPESIANISFSVYGRNDSQEVVGSWEDFAGRRVAYLYDQFYIEKHMPKSAHISRASSNAVLLQGLLEEQYDFVVLVHIYYNEEPSKFDGLSLLASLDPQEAFTFLNYKYAELAPLLSEQYAIMKHSGIMASIFNRSYRGETESSEPLLLHIASSHTDDSWERELGQGLFSIIDPKPITTLFYNLDTLRYPYSEDRNRLNINLIRTDLMARNPDIIVVSGNMAFKFVKEHYNQIFYGTPVVFCGVDGYTPSMITGYESCFTGLAEVISVEETVELIKELFPDTMLLYAVNDYSSASSDWRENMSQELLLNAQGMEVRYSPNATLLDTSNEIATLQNGAVAIFGMYYTDSDNRYLRPDYSLPLLSSALGVPSFGLRDTLLGYGQIGGKVADARKTGEEAAELALRILSGEKVSDIPVDTDTSRLNVWKFDDAALKKWEIKDSQLPVGSVILGRRKSLLETNPVELSLIMALVFAAMVGLVGLLIFMRQISKKNKQLIVALANLHTAEEMLEKDMTIKSVKERLELIIDSSPICYSLSENGTVVEVNEIARDSFGIDNGESIISIFVNPFDASEVMAGIEKNGSVSGLVKCLRMKNGNYARHIINGVRLEYENKPAVVLWGVDIEESEHQKDVIRHAQRDLEKVLYALPSPVLLLDIDSGDIVYVNKSMRDMFGFSSLEEAVSVKYFDLFPEFQPDGTTSIENVKRRIDMLRSATNVINWESRYKLPSGAFLDAYVSSGVIYFNDRLTIVVILRDVTAEKEQQRMLREIAEREKENNQLKSRFLVNMSHEIRTPMNAIIGLSELALRKERLDEEASAETLNKISISAKILLNIINDILDFSKIEAEKLALFNEEFELEEVLSNIILLSSQRLGEKKVEMLLDVALDVPVKLISDRTRLWQILKNFLDNASKFTMKGRILFAVSLKSISEDTAWLNFTISDTGIGISKQALERIFTPFEQFHNPNQVKQTGTGLGMTIAKQLIELMGGSVSLKSKEGVGTTVECSIPFILPQDVMLLKDVYTQIPLWNIKILAVDDDPVALSIVEKLISAMGVSVTCVSCGKEAVLRAAEDEENGIFYNVVLLDYSMPGLDGIGTARLMSEKLNYEPKMILASSYSVVEVNETIDKYGFVDVLEKPFSPSVFYNKLMRALGHTVKVEDLIANEFYTFEGARVLLCEDNLINRDVAVGILEEFGINPVVAENGKEAIELLEKQEFDLMLLDIQMPVMDGHEATVLIRSSTDKPYHNIPIVAMTANVMQEEIKRCMDEGMNGHVPKPIEFEKLQSYLLAFLPNSVQNEAFVSVGYDDADIPDIEGLDVKKALRQYGGDMESFQYALRRFMKHSEAFPKSFEQVIGGHGIRNSLILVQELLGSALDIGATGVHKSAREFERQLRLNVPDILKYQELSQRIQELREQISLCIKTKNI